MNRHEIQIKPSLCIGCDQCAKDCPTSNIQLKDKKAEILEAECIMCGHCAAICPKKAAGDMRNALLTFLIHESPSLHIADIGCIPLCTSLISYLRIPQKQRCDRFFSFWYCTADSSPWW